jgi:hypothetical protein
MQLITSHLGMVLILEVDKSKLRVGVVWLAHDLTGLDVTIAPEELVELGFCPLLWEPTDVDIGVVR